MSKSAESLSTFLFHFLERLNDYESIEKKVMGSLTDICDYCGFKRGFVYQTDGFRYFYLKETVGNEDNTLRSRFEMGEMTKQHLARTKDKKEPFCVDGHEGSSLADIDIMDFYKVKSLLIRHFEDTEGKIIGFIGFADREEGASSFTKEESQAIYLALGALSKEISIREYKEREVRASKTLGSIMNNMGVDIYVNSFDSHDMLYANEAMAAPYGGIEHFEGKKCWQALYTDKTGECEFCPKRHLIDENGLPTKVYSWDYQRPFDKCWFRVFSAAFAWIDGQMAHVITSVDIDHQKKIEEELRIAKEKAENLDRLKSAFLANMSHEIRTPLNAIVGFSSLLINSVEPSEELQEYANIIQTNSNLLLQLISDVLDVSRLESGKLQFNYEWCELVTHCQNMITLTNRNKTTNADVRLQMPKEPYMLYTDPLRLQQIIINLLNNALKFTPAGGSITLDYTVDKEKQCMLFSVTDTGTGIPEDKQELVFQRFEKLNEFVQGTGLGLAICKLTIQYMGGDIWIDKDYKGGARFIFSHPIKERESTEK